MEARRVMHGGLPLPFQAKFNKHLITFVLAAHLLRYED